MPDTEKMLNESILTALAEAGKTTRDVVWIGTRDGMLSVNGFADFAQVAQGVPVDKAPRLVVVGLDWWLEMDTWRSWRFNQRPHRKMAAKRFVFRRDETNWYRLEPAETTA